jgi:uncharacterized membrane protein
MSWGLSGLGLVLGARQVATVALVVVAATPLARVVWLIVRWAQEGDRRYVAMGLALMTVIGLGAVLAVVGR